LDYLFPHNLNSVCYISIYFAGICLRVQHSYSLGELSSLFFQKSKKEEKKEKSKKEKRKKEEKIRGKKEIRKSRKLSIHSLFGHW
jgi:hypothetical protein